MGAETSKQFGFLGAGVIAEVFVRRLLASATARPEHVLAYDINTAILTRLAATHGIRAAGSNAEVAAGCAVLFIAVPPPVVLVVLREVAQVLEPTQMVISLAAGVSTARMEAAIGKPVAVIRTIPNIPAWIGHGMTPFCVGTHVGAAERAAATALLRTFGRIAEVPEEQMAIATALTAVGPTYVFPVIAALADAAAAQGFPPGLALSAACQVVSGSAALVAESKRSPEGLSLMISTRTLDEAAAKNLFRQAVADAHGKILALQAKIETGVPKAEP